VVAGVNPVATTSAIPVNDLLLITHPSVLFEPVNGYNRRHYGLANRANKS
jgi:hypothetical protein